MRRRCRAAAPLAADLVLKLAVAAVPLAAHLAMTSPVGALGRFVEDFAEVPVRIANHIGRQLGLPLSLVIAEPECPATASEQEQRIREYLGYRAFDAQAQQQMKRWLADRCSRCRSGDAS